MNSQENAERLQAEESLKAAKKELEGKVAELETHNRVRTDASQIGGGVTPDLSALYAALIKSSDDAVIGMTLEGIIASWNKGAERLYGYTALEAIGQPISFLVPKDRLDEMPDIYEKIKRGEVVLHYETVRVRKDGQRIDISLNVSPIRDTAGTLVGFSSIIRDITERKHMEQKLVRNQRVMMSLLEDVQASKEVAEAATRAKAQFLANMSHEIRTPMNAVIGMTGLLLDTSLTVQQRDLAETVRSSGEALLTIINDILDFSKIESGKLALETTDFDLQDCVKRARELFAEAASIKHVPLIFSIEEDVPRRLQGDAGRLRQVLLNLLSNALKFTAKGEVVLSVSQVSQTATDALIRFAVRDTGIGISAEALGRLFQPFSQADNSTARKYGGTGLGLAISKQLVELMGGHFEVQSQPGQGSTFSFSIPLLKQPDRPPGEQDAMPTHAQQTEAGAAPLDPSSMRLLVAEDNMANQKLTVLLLTKLGYKADVVANGQEAVEALSRIAYDVVLMDCLMPEMDGYSATQEIRSREARQKHTPIIALTANAKKEDRDRCLAVGMDDYIAKPVDAPQLKRVLEKWSNTVSHGSPAPADTPAPTGQGTDAPDDLVDECRLKEISD